MDKMITKNSNERLDVPDKKLKNKDILCPVCGYYCIRKTVFCTPPFGDKHKGK